MIIILLRTFQKFFCDLRWGLLTTCFRQTQSWNQRVQTMWMRQKMSKTRVDSMCCPPITSLKRYPWKHSGWGSLVVCHCNDRQVARWKEWAKTCEGEGTGTAVSIQDFRNETSHPQSVAVQNTQCWWNYLHQFACFGDVSFFWKKFMNHQACQTRIEPPHPQNMNRQEPKNEKYSFRVPLLHWPFRRNPT